MGSCLSRTSCEEPAVCGNCRPVVTCAFQSLQASNWYRTVGVYIASLYNSTKRMQLLGGRRSPVLLHMTLIAQKMLLLAH